MNVLSIECFMDELAAESGQDPIEFRLRHLTDPRARTVLDRLASVLGWPRDGTGIAFGRYKNTAAYVAVGIEVELEEVVRARAAWCVFDAGLRINPDGAANQIEGGIVQSISWTLKERVGFDGRCVTSESWDKYPILRFDEAPTLWVEAIDAPHEAPLGVGEASQGPAAAAICNAVARTLGAWIRDLPLDKNAVLSAML